MENSFPAGRCAGAKTASLPNPATGLAASRWLGLVGRRGVRRACGPSSGVSPNAVA